MPTEQIKIEVFMVAGSYFAEKLPQCEVFKGNATGSSPICKYTHAGNFFS